MNVVHCLVLEPHYENVFHSPLFIRILNAFGQVGGFQSVVLWMERESNNLSLLYIRRVLKILRNILEYLNPKVGVELSQRCFVRQLSLFLCFSGW